MTLGGTLNDLGGVDQLLKAQAVHFTVHSSESAHGHINATLCSALFHRARHSSQCKSVIVKFLCDSEVRNLVIRALDFTTLKDNKRATFQKQFNLFYSIVTCDDEV